MSYEKFKHQVMVQLTEQISSDLMPIVLRVLDTVACDYNISEITKALSVPTGDLPELAKIYLAAKKIEGLSDATLYNKHMYLRLFYAAVSKPTESVTANDIRVFLYNYQAERKISNSSVDGVRKALTSYFAWLSGEGYIERDPSKTIKPIKQEQKQRLSLSQMEMEYLRRACETLRETAIVEFLFSTGCRVSELANLKISDVDFQTDEVHLFGKGKKHRTSYLNAKAHVALEDYLKSRKDNDSSLFVRSRRPYVGMGTCAIENIIRTLNQRAGIAKKVTPHILRHTTATQAVGHGMPVQDVQKLLGHSNISTTMIYVETSDADVRSGHKKAVV
jgi:integrase/recombinase XerD